MPFFGNVMLLKQLSKESGGQHLALQKLAEQYKTKVLGLKLGGDNIVAVFSYEVVRKILTEDVYEGRPDNYFIRLRCMGTRRGKQWYTIVLYIKSLQSFLESFCHE